MSEIYLNSDLLFSYFIKLQIDIEKKISAKMLSSVQIDPALKYGESKKIRN